MLLQFSDLSHHSFGELSAMTRLAVRTITQGAVLKHKSDERVEMYSTTLPNGVFTIRRNGHDVRGVWDEKRDIANEICDLLNSPENDPCIFLTKRDRKWLRAIGRASRKGQHA